MTISSFKGDNHFLSNFYMIDVEYQCEVYPSSEHAYQAAKIGNWEQRCEIIRKDKLFDMTAGQSKRWGKNVPCRSDWEQVKYSIMQHIVIAKFADKNLRTKLAETHPHELIEGNWHGDKYWGVCDGEGQNNLGKILMSVRNDLVFGGMT